MTEPATVAIEETRFGALCDMRQRVTETLAIFNTAAADAKAKRKAYETARDTFEREFDRVVAFTKGEDLPLFNQSELLERAQADPVVSKLVDRMLARDMDVNAIMVAGYTEAERVQLTQYLDALDLYDAWQAGEQKEGVEAVLPDVPAFLIPQPYTAIEVASIMERLAAADVDDATEEEIQGWSLRQRAEAIAFLDGTERVKAEKGDALTADDLPGMPEFLAEAPGEPADEETEAEQQTANA